MGAMIYEGLAATPEEAEKLAAGGRVAFAPCHEPAAERTAQPQGPDLRAVAHREAAAQADQADFRDERVATAQQRELLTIRVRQRDSKPCRS